MHRTSWYLHVFSRDHLDLIDCNIQQSGSDRCAPSRMFCWIACLLIIVNINTLKHVANLPLIDFESYKFSHREGYIILFSVKPLVCSS
jgi:hypothetical protein